MDRRPARRSGGEPDRRADTLGGALDGVTYGGAFALQLARRADTVTAVDISEQAAAQGREAAARNGVKNVELKVANAFDLLRDESDKGERYDTIVLDPPAFAKSKSSLDAALRGYKEINLRAFHLLSRGGVLVTCSCSFHIDDAQFERTVLAAAGDAKRSVQVVERRGAGRDHPTLLGVPETRLRAPILQSHSRTGCWPGAAAAWDSRANRRWRGAAALGDRHFPSVATASR